MVPSKRKKWSEAEEKTLIEKYGQMVSQGNLVKMKTREKKFRPIAIYVNLVHHARDPVTFPWQWTWKDVSTKVQNMRHQYLLVKQKIKRTDDVDVVENSGGGGESVGVDEFDWMEGLTHWSNFLRYKEVFGDVSGANGVSNGMELVGGLNEDRENGGQFLVGVSDMELVDFGSLVNSGEGDFPGIDGVENGVMDLEFDYEGEEAEENCDGSGDRVMAEGNDALANENRTVGCHLSSSRGKCMSTGKGMEKRVFGFLSCQLGKLREMEVRMEQQELDREKERKRRDIVQMEREKEWERRLEKMEREREERDEAREKLRRQRIRKWEAVEIESEEVQKRKREEELIEHREWEEMISERRSESKKRIDGMLNQHQAEMADIQARILHEQQSLTGQLLGIVAQWTGHSVGLSDHTSSASNHYFTQMIQNLHHVNGMIHIDDGIDGEDAQEDQFIVDGE